MARDTDAKATAGELRARAESMLRLKAVRRAAPGDADAKRLLHELDVHQVELELQCEELQRTQVELAASRDRYRELYDVAPVGYLGLDRSGRIIDANLTLARLLGVERDQLPKRPLAAFMEERHADLFHRVLHQVFGEGGPLSCEVVLQRGGQHAGREIPVHVSCLALTDEQGARTECRAAVTDLSDLRAAQEGYRASESYSNMLLDTASDAIVGSDATGRIESFNKAAERMFGYRREEVLGQNVRLLMPSPYREEHDLYMQRFLSTGEAHIIGKPNREVTGLRKDGTAFPLELGIGEWWDRGQRKFTAILHDISERKQAEAERARIQAQLNQSQKLEAVGTLASGVAHDFSNVLMGISGCATIARDALPQDTPARLYLDEIQRSADSGASIARRLLTFSRARNAELSVFELNDVVADTEHLLRHLLAEDIDLVVRLEAKDSRVLADSGALEQVLVNLAVNARDAMPEGGRLTIETSSRVARRVDDAGPGMHEHVALTIADTGLGMCEAVRQRVFEPFFTTKEIGKGTGLGLSTVHGIIRQAGGQIQVQSHIGRGTSFEILLPRTEQPLSRPASDAAPDSRELARGQGTILLVEDNRAVRLGIRYQLEGAGYRVLEAADGLEAVECCAKYPSHIDLLLTDVVLPGMGGPRIAHEVRRLQPGISVLYMSAHPAEWLENEQRIPLGVRPLQKPFGAEVLLSRVRSLIGSEPRSVHGAESNLHELPHGPPKTILIAEDEPSALLAISGHFRELGWEVLEASDGRQALELCKGHQHEIMALLIDHALPKMMGDVLARELKALCPEAALVYMSGYPDLKLDPPGVVLSKPLHLEAISQTLVRVTRARARRKP